VGQLRERGGQIDESHLAGDALSPSIIGLLSDASGRLDLALFIVPVAVAIGAAIWLSGWRRLPA
jgi:hypothetical protein